MFKQPSAQHQGPRGSLDPAGLADGLPVYHLSDLLEVRGTFGRDSMYIHIYICLILSTYIYMCIYIYIYIICMVSDKRPVGMALGGHYLRAPSAMACFVVQFRMAVEQLRLKATSEQRDSQLKQQRTHCITWNMLYITI